MKHGKFTPIWRRLFFFSVFLVDFAGYRDVEKKLGGGVQNQAAT